MAKQKVFEGINDPCNYRNLCEPISRNDANARLQAFCEELYELRNKHKIKDVYAVLQVNVVNGEDKGTITSCMHCGSELERENMAAFAYGFERSRRT